MKENVNYLENHIWGVFYICNNGAMVNDLRESKESDIMTISEKEQVSPATPWWNVRNLSKESSLLLMC